MEFFDRSSEEYLFSNNTVSITFHIFEHNILPLWSIKAIISLYQRALWLDCCVPQTKQLIEIVQ